MIKTNISTTTYKVDDFSNYMIDITDDGEKYVAYVYNARMIVKRFMFSVSKDTITFDDFVLQVSITAQDYVENYIADYLADDDDSYIMDQYREEYSDD